MRYANRINLIVQASGGDGPDDKPSQSVINDVPCNVVGITKADVLSVYGLVNVDAYEVHLAGDYSGVTKVKRGGITYNVAKTIRPRGRTVLIVSLGG